jgi:hypothetical protein
MSDGPPPAAGLSSKDEVKTPVFEKIGKAIEQHLLENEKIRTTDKGRARMEEFLLAMSEGTAFTAVPNDVDTYGIPYVVMNRTVEKTFGYLGITIGQLWTLEYELLHSLRTGIPRRTVFLSRILLEKHQLLRGGPSVYSSFLAYPEEPNKERVFVKGVTLEVTEVLTPDPD